MKDKRVLVTGGTSGIGAAVVKCFAKEGAKVAFTGRSAAKAARVGCGRFFECDHAGDAETTMRCVREAAEWLGGLDVVVVAAGVVREGDLEASDAGQYAEVFDTNVRAAWATMRAAVPFLREAAPGEGARKRPGVFLPVVVTICSDWGVNPAGEAALYSASKAALIALTKSMGKSEGRFGVRTVALCVGDTFVERWVDEALDVGDYPAGTDRGLIEENMRDRIDIVAGRTSDAGEVAAFLYSLCLPTASYLSACEVLFDGGGVC